MKELARVSSYQTSDGNLHADKAEALTHEAKIEIRAMIQSRPIIGAGATMTPAQVAEFVIGEADKMNEFLRSYREKLRHARPKTK